MAEQIEKTQMSCKKVRMKSCRQKFREDWRKHPALKDWIYYKNGDSQAFCQYCQTSVKCKLSTLLAHAMRVKHITTHNAINGTVMSYVLPQTRTVEYLTDLRGNQCSGSNFSFNLIQDLSLKTCQDVIKLAKTQQILTLALTNNLNIQVIQEILQCKKYIRRIFQYVPNPIRFIKPTELNNIIAINEILKEFMLRLMHHNLNITNEEFMLNAKMLTSVFDVTKMNIDADWVHFFQKNIQQYNSIEKPIEKMHKTYFYVRNIFEQVKHKLDSEVAARFVEHLQKQSDDLILVCAEMFGKQRAFRKQTQQQMSQSDQQSLHKEQPTITTDMIVDLIENQELISDTTDEESSTEEEIELGVYSINAEEYMTNEDCDSNQMIEIYAEVSDEDDDENLMAIDQQTEITPTTVDETEWKIDEECYIKLENENQEYIATEAGLFISADPDETKRNIDEECCIKQENENLEYIATEAGLLISADPDEIKRNTDEECCIKQENENQEYIAREADLLRYSLELMVDQIKTEPIELNSNEYIKEEEFSEDSQAMQSPPKHSPKELMESEIKQEQIETNAPSDNDIYIVQDESEELQAMQCLIQQKYVASMIYEIKEEPVETNVNPDKSATYNQHEHLTIESLENLVAEVDASVDGSVDDSVDNSADESKTDTNEETMCQVVATQLNFSNHLNEQRALQIGKTLNLRRYGELYREILALDPIICTYMFILLNKPPHLSDAALRMAFQVVLGEELYDCQYKYSIQPDDLELYRHLVLLDYSTKYGCHQLKDMVKADFNDVEIESILNNSQQILEEWRKFFNKHFISMLYRKAVYELLFEYSTRHSIISAQLDRNAIEALPRTTTKDIQQFLHSDFELGKNWPQRYNEYIRKKVNKNPNDFCRVFTTTDLSLNRIYADIKERLPQIVLENVSYTSEGGNDVLNVNSDVSESSSAVYRLNLNSSKELKDGKAAVENDEQNSQQKNLIIQKDQYNNIYSKPKIMQGDIIIETSIKEPPNKKPKIDEFMQTVVSKNNSKDIQSVETSRDSEISTGIELLPEDIHMNANPPETIEIAEIQKIKKWDKSHFICALHNDPIIASYLSFSRLCYREHLPVYSASILQKAFKDVFKENNIGKYSVCQPQDFQLYSKMLLFYYSSHRKYKSRITDIMICFDEKTIKEYFVNFPNIITEWRTFFEKNLSRLLYKEAIYEMLYEYTQRYLRIEKEISDEDLVYTAAKIQRFLRCHITLPDRWLEHFSALFKSRLNNNDSSKVILLTTVSTKHIIKNSSKLSENYLDFLTIYQFVKHRLNFLITENISKELGSPNHVDAGGIFQNSIDPVIIEQLEQDPIMMAYFQLLSGINRVGKSLPVFNEDILRVSFNEVFKKCPVQPGNDEHYELYRQLILFKYSEKCSSVAELAKIMTCFSESTIQGYLKRYLSIILEWHKFNVKFLSVFFLRKALNEMLYDYYRKYTRIYGHVYGPNHLKQKSEEIKAFFYPNFELPTNWLSDFYKILISVSKSNKDDNTKLSYSDLKLENIYESVKNRLHFSIVEKRDLIVTTCKKEEQILTNESVKVFMENIKPIEQYVRKELMRVNDESDAQLHRAKSPQVSCENTKLKLDNEGTQESYAHETNEKKTSNINIFEEIEEIGNDRKDELIVIYKVSIENELNDLGDSTTEDIIAVVSDEAMNALKQNNLKK